MKKYTSKELFEMEAVEVYKLVLRKDIKIFPKGFWKQPEAKQNAAKCVRFLIEEVLNLSDEELKEKLEVKLLKQYKLNGMMLICFNGSAIKAIDNAYPNKFKPWEFKITPNGYWDDINNAILATKWLIEEKLKLSDEELKEQLSIKLFINNGLKGMIDICFNGSPYESINAAYPNKFKPWEFKITPDGYWDDINNSIKATKWLIEEKLKLSDEELKEQLSIKMFQENGLNGMLGISYNNSPYKAINSVYPNKFKPWEFKVTGLNYWLEEENRVNTIRWLIEEKLKLSDEQIKKQLCSKLFINEGLGSLLNSYFNGSPYEAINVVYPNKFKKEDFKNHRYFKSYKNNRK